MTLTIITKSNLESASYNNIFTTIDTRTYISDPRTGTVKSRIFVYDSDPLAKSINFGLFPYIVVELPELTYQSQSGNGKEKIIEWSMNITVRTIREGTNGFNIDTGRTDMQNICNDLQETFNDFAIRTALGVCNMHKINLTKISSDTVTIDQKETYEARYRIDFMTRLVISS
jgi:hypothetical protein